MCRNPWECAISVIVASSGGVRRSSAEAAASAGVIDTKEGSTGYEAGDYLVYNGPDRTDGYAVGREKFEEMYEPAD